MKLIGASQNTMVKRNAYHRAGLRLPSFQSAFTLVELITIMVILGVLAATALPRFFDRNTFDSRGFYDQAISTLRHAQKIAVAQRRFVCVTFALNSITLSLDPNPPSAVYTTATCPGSSLLIGPAGQNPYTINAPNGVTLAGGGNFNFDALGRAIGFVAPLTVDSYTINIDQGTGYVH